MKKFLIIFLLVFAEFSFAQDFNLYYQFLADYNKENFLIKLRNFEKEEFFLCSLKNFYCQKTETPKLSYSFLSNIAEKIFVSDDLNFYLYFTKIIKDNFILIENKNNNQIKTLKITFNPERVFFSKDKNKILFISNQKIYLLSLDNNQITQLETKINGSYLTPSPSFKYLAFYKPANISENERKYYLLDLSNENLINFLSEKIEYWDLLTENNKIFDFVDDNNLIFLSDKDDFQTLYLYKINENKIERLFNENFVVKNFFVDRNKIYLVGNKENPLIWNLYEFDLNSKNLKLLVQNVAYDFRIFKIDDFIVFKKTDDLPPRIGVYNLSTNQENYFSLGYFQEKIQIGEIKNYEDLWFVEYLPENLNKQTLIVWLHGGPHRQTSPGFHPYLSYGFYDYLLEKLRQDGYLIVKLDYPGSFGYGRKFAESIKNNIGKIDVESVIKIIEFEKQKYNIKKVYLMGNSYGGYLALKTLYDYPNLIDGAISINGVTDWWLLIKRNPKSIFRIHFNGPPNEQNRFLYDQASIFLNKNNLKNKKILIAYGLDDRTIPSYQQLIFIENYYQIANIEEKIYKEKHSFINKETFQDLLNNIKVFLQN